MIDLMILHWPEEEIRIETAESPEFDTTCVINCKEISTTMCGIILEEGKALTITFHDGTKITLRIRD